GFLFSTFPQGFCLLFRAPLSKRKATRRWQPEHKDRRHRQGRSSLAKEERKRLRQSWPASWWPRRRRGLPRASDWETFHPATPTLLDPRRLQTRRHRGLPPPIRRSPPDG